MLVSQYRYVDNAAALAAIGLLADNRDLSRRKTPLIRLDDPAFLIEGVVERLDLAGAPYGLTTLPAGCIDRSLYAGVYFSLRDLMGRIAEYDQIKFLTVYPSASAGSVAGFKPLSVAGAQSLEAAVDADFGGARDRLSNIPHSGSQLAWGRMPWYQHVKDMSDVLYDFVCFRAGVNGLSLNIGLKATITVTPDSAAQGATFDDAFYYKRFDRATNAGVTTETTKEWGSGTSAQVTIEKGSASRIPLTSSEYGPVIAVIKVTAQRSWGYEVERGGIVDRETYSGSETAYALVRMTLSGSTLTATISLGNRGQQETYLDQAFGSVPAFSTDGWHETVVETISVPYLIFLTSPVAVSATRFTAI